MTPVTRYLLAADIEPTEFSARLIRKVRSLNFTVVAHCGDTQTQTALIKALNRFELEPQLEIQSGQIAVCEDAAQALRETSNNVMLKLVQNSLLLNLADEPVTAFSRFQRYAEITEQGCGDLEARGQWFSDRGYAIEDHPIFEA